MNTSSLAQYDFLLRNGDIASQTASDALTAFHKLKKANQDIYFRLRRFERSQLTDVPEGFSALDIGYGLSLAYRRIPADREEQ